MEVALELEILPLLWSDWSWSPAMGAYSLSQQMMMTRISSELLRSARHTYLRICTYDMGQGLMNSFREECNMCRYIVH